MSDYSQASLLEDLPAEIRLQILEYLLPLDSSNNKSITIPVWQHVNSYPPSHLQARETYPSGRALRRYLNGIGLANRKFHTDSMYIFHQCTFILEICEDFMRECRFPHSSINRFHNCSSRQWRQILPGIDLASVKELRIHVALTGSPDGWSLVQRALPHFCDMLDRRVGVGAFRRLVIDITGTRASPYSTSWNDWGTTWSELDPLTLPIDDFVVTLFPFRNFLGNAQECEIRIPEWAKDHQNVMEMVDATRNAICTRRECPYKQEEDWCFPPLENEEEGGWPEVDWEENVVAKRKEYIWMKAPGEEWDDWYDMPKPRFDYDYDLSDSAWMLAEEGVLEDMWGGNRWLEWQYREMGWSDDDNTAIVSLRPPARSKKPSRVHSTLSTLKHAIGSPLASLRAARKLCMKPHKYFERSTASKKGTKVVAYWRDEEHDNRKRR